MRRMWKAGRARPGRRRRRSLVWPRGVAAALGAWLASAGCAGPAAPARRAPSVILISLDGTTPDAVRRAGLEALTGLMGRGAVASRLLPAFPSNTFPNHVTLVTGVAPEVHGIVNNSFRDPVRGLYLRSADPSWIEVEPLWALAERHGIVSASFHWVGSEGPWSNGRGPRHWRRFDSGVGEGEKVEQILHWLDLADPRRRPRLVTAWFHGADGSAHRYGPDAPEVAAALRPQDRALAQLVAGLEARGALGHTTLLLVSDHGMAEVRRTLDPDEVLKRAGVGGVVLGAGGFATLWLETPDDAGRAVDALRAEGIEAHRRDAAPAELRVGSPRFGDLVLLAPPGSALGSSAPGRPPLRGAHGYRPDAPGMAGLFVAVGRGAAPGSRLGELRAVDVAPTVLALLGLPVPPWMEGRPVAALIPGSSAVPGGSPDP